MKKILEILLIFFVIDDLLSMAAGGTASAAVQYSASASGGSAYFHLNKGSTKFVSIKTNDSINPPPKNLVPGENKCTPRTE